MGSVGCLAKGNIFFFWKKILKNRPKYTGDISEQSVVCIVLISAIIIEIFRKNIPISYIISYKNLASPLIPVCLKKSHMSSQPVRSCSPDLIPCRHVRSDVPYPRDPAAPSCYLVCMLELLFLPREIMHPHPDTS